MKFSLRRLATVRRIVASFVLGLFLFALLYGRLGEALLPVLGMTQAGMALTAVAGAVSAGASVSALYGCLLAAQAVLALLCGRVFCSWLCPLGALQDVYHHIYTRASRGWAAQAGRQSPQAGRGPRGRLGAKGNQAGGGYLPGSAWRYAIPALLLAALFWQGPRFFGLAEPFSLFARAAHTLVQPCATLAVNLAAELGDATGLFMLPRAVWKFDAAALALALPSLALVLWLAGRGSGLPAGTPGAIGAAGATGAGPRGYCNSICPVGALLGLINGAAAAGGLPYLRPRFTDSCIGCGRCARACKAHCLDSAARNIDASRCLSCYNCLEACPGQGMALLPGPVRAAGAVSAGAAPLAGVAFPARTKNARRDRLALLRGLVLTGTACLAGGAGAFAASIGRKAQEGGLSSPAKEGDAQLMPVLPPGALSLAHLESRCTGCHSCLTVCPPQVLRMSGPAAWGAGGAGRMTLPAMDYFRAFCQIGCARCTLVCPSGALTPLGLEEKKRVQIGRAALKEDLCVVVTEKNRCGACAEHCPTGAITMGPEMRDGLAIPVIDQDRCIGCGACQYACPVRPEQAVIVSPLAVHALALPPRAAEGAKELKSEEAFPF